MKVAVIGAGSTYTPELAQGFLAHADTFPLDELALMDIDVRRLEIVGSFAERLLARGGSGRTRVIKTTDRREAVSGADFVIAQIRVGGQKARHEDTILALGYGTIGQETTGVGGFAKAMRTIPAMLDIAKDIAEVAPGAWLINFTNPSGLVTEAVSRHSPVKTIGLCNGPYGTVTAIAAGLGVPREKVWVDYVGLNHLSWIRRVMVDGRDVTDEVVKEIVSRYKAANVPEADFSPEFIEALGMIPSSYLRYYYLRDEMAPHLAAQPKTRAEVVMQVEEKLLELYADPSRDTVPEELSKRGGAYYSTVAVALMDAIVNDRRDVHIINIPNGGTVPDLSPGAVVETPAVVGRAGAYPVVTGGRLEPSIRGLIQAVKAYEELTIRAAVERSRRHAILALAAHPLVGSVNKAVSLVGDLDSRYGWDLR